MKLKQIRAPTVNQANLNVYKRHQPFLVAQLVKFWREYLLYRCAYMYRQILKLLDKALITKVSLNCFFDSRLGFETYLE